MNNSCVVKPFFQQLAIDFVVECHMRKSGHKGTIICGLDQYAACCDLIIGWSQLATDKFIVVDTGKESML